MPKRLIIVESPAKARTISRFLGGDYLVESSIGHIRDLPAKPADIPPSLRGKPWARTGVDIENDFEPLWVVPTDKKPQVKKLKDLLKTASELYLATDEDREGEAIAWHLQEVLKPKIPVKRMVFHEITEQAIQAALDSPRAVDLRLVDAQEARRILDRLFGYELSPVLWRKVRPRLSAGRVQSVATRLVVERERARIAFVRASYSSITATLGKLEEPPQTFTAELQQLDGRRLAIGRHFDPATGKLSQQSRAERVLLLEEGLAGALRDSLEKAEYSVASLERKPFSQRPHAPFITSTLQQEAGRKLRFSAQRAMRVAQSLYERGYITYMRTDSTTLSQQAVDAARAAVSDLYGADYLPERPRKYATKSKSAQEAHEAIRPAGERFRRPESLRSELNDDAFRMYSLIWTRTVACQMKDAKGERSRVQIRAFADLADAGPSAERSGVSAGRHEAMFAASGKVITFPGYLRAYVEGADDPKAELEDKERLLPALQEGEPLRQSGLSAQSHTTQPPARYTEASLVKELEERGIGRPSTYASIIQTIQDRGYVWKQGTALVPTLTAFAVTNLLERHFDELVDYAFTARMEDDLDAISSGEKKAKPWLKAFYFGAAADATANGKPGLKQQISDNLDEIDAREVCSLPIGKDAEGRVIAARVGRYGPYIQVEDEARRAPIPDGVLPDQLDQQEAERLLAQQDLANRALGVDPESGKSIYLKAGIYGPYVQLGEPELTPKGKIKKGGKPKMASLWPGMTVETLTFDTALQLLSFPREVGIHPETKAPIIARDGKYGPFIQMVGENLREARSLPDHQALLTVDVAQAVELFKQPAKRQRSRQILKELGISKITDKPIEVRNGRFGPYVTDGEVNATIPRGNDPQSVTLDQALDLISAREQKLLDQGKQARGKKAKVTKKKAAKKTPAKKTPAKKAPAKKAPAKKAPAKKTPAKKTPAKKTPAKKTPAKKAPAKKAAKKKVTKKTPAKKNAEATRTKTAQKTA